MLCTQFMPPDMEDPMAGPAAGDAPGEARCQTSLQQFLVSNYALLQRKLTGQLGCPDLASDCLHDAWLRLGTGEIRSAVSSPEAYVCRVARNAAVDRARSHRPWQYASDAELELLADDAPGPDDIASARADLAAVERAMERLPRRHRSVLIALCIDDIPRREVAARYALSLRGVDTALRQALDYCGARAGRRVLNGVSGPRRALQP